MQVEKNLIINGREVWADMHDALKAYRSKAARRFGKDVGGILAEVLIGAQSEEQTHGHEAEAAPVPVKGELSPLDGKQVLLGLLEGFGAAVPNFEGCIGRQAATLTCCPAYLSMPP